jgi:hypothetical protein
VTAIVEENDLVVEMPEYSINYAKEGIWPIRGRPYRYGPSEIGRQKEGD